MARNALSKITKVGAWWAVVLGGMGAIGIGWGLESGYFGNVGGDYILIGFGLYFLWLTSVPLLVSGILLLVTGRKWAWVLTVGSLIFAALFAYYTSLGWAGWRTPGDGYHPDYLLLSSLSVFYLVPPFLLVIDEMAQDSLPTKTNIAAWWTIAVGVSIPVLGTVLLHVRPEHAVWEVWVLTATAGVGALYLFPSTFLLLRRTWAWIVAVAILALDVVGVLAVAGFYFFLFGYYAAGLLALILVLTPVPVILLDRKAYWEMTRRLHGGQ